MEADRHSKFQSLQNTRKKRKNKGKFTNEITIYLSDQLEQVPYDTLLFIDVSERDSTIAA